MQWIEPSAVVQAKRACLGIRGSWIFYATIAAVVGLVVVGMGSLYRPANDRAMQGTWAEIGVLAAGFGLATGGALYIINEVLGADIILSEKGITRKRFEFFTLTFETWSVEDIARGTLTQVKIAGRNYPILLVHGKAGGAYPIGLGSAIPEDVHGWFTQYGKRVDVETDRAAQDLQSLMTEPLPPSQNQGMIM